MFALSAVQLRKRMDARIASRLIEALVPRNLATLPIETIAELRFELATQRLRFAGAVQAVTDEFAKIASPSELPRIEAQIEEIAQQRIEETKRAYVRARATAIVQAVGMTLVPAPVASIHSLLNIGIFAPTAILAAATLGLSTLYFQLDKASSDKNTSPWSYVFELQKALK